MATLTDRSPENVAGRFYVDSSCIDCDLCRNTAPAIFVRHDEIGLTIVLRQPADDEEIELARQAMEECPTNSIGDSDQGD